MSTLTRALLDTATRYGDKTAVLDADATYNWRDFLDRIARAAGLLKDLGVDRGDRFAIIALNSCRQAELTYAGYWLGATPVPINFRLAAPEIGEIIRDAGCKLLAVDANFVHLLQTPELEAWKDTCLYLFSSENIAGNNYETLIDNRTALGPADTCADDEAILLYTGGTTGKSKGVPLSHDNILCNARQIGSLWPASTDDVVLHLPPMFHSAELVKTIYMLHGAAHVYLPRFEPELLLQTIEKYRVTFVLMVPTVIMLVLDSGLLGKFDLSSLKQLIYGASPMPPAWIKKTLAAFPGVQIAQGYGLTETSPLLSMLDHQSHLAALAGNKQARLASCGRLLPGVEISIVDEEDHVLPLNAEGEIKVRGNNISKGYLNKPALNAEVFANGWFRTGDIGYLDEDGFLYLKDRKHDVIMSAGEKIYSSEVEAVINLHPDVIECAVIGIPDLKYGEKVHAVVVTSPESILDEAELIDYCRTRIGGYKLPRSITMAEQLPKSSMGKVLKSELRKMYRKNYDH